MKARKHVLVRRLVMKRRRSARHDTVRGCA
jgi:hypothetical protein